MVYLYSKPRAGDRVVHAQTAFTVVLRRSMRSVSRHAPAWGPTPDRAMRSHHALLPERGDALLVEADRGEHLVGLLAESRRGP